MFIRQSGMKGGGASFIVTFLLAALMPARIGQQDLSTLISHLPGVAARARAHLIASPFGTIHAATFSFPMLSGASTTDAVGYRLVSLNTGDPDGAESFAARNFFDGADAEPPRAFPQVNRSGKSDRLVPRAHDATDHREQQLETAPAAGAPLAALSPPAELVPEANARPSIADEAEAALADPDHGEVEPAVDELGTLDGDEHPTLRTARIYFDTAPLGGGPQSALQPWAPGEAPELDLPPPMQVAPHAEGQAAPPSSVTIAGKGEVTGAGKHPKSPAERLNLTAVTRPKEEKCLANAIYFESRGEQARGQVAVAQVVMNRVFSGYYPDTVCGVVYQNANRRLACQFTFACDGIPDRVTEPEAWVRAKHIAKDTLDGKYWLSDVGKATHYHAYWVHPWWVRTMRKLDRIGVHTFYRPRRWGDGADQPKWGDAAATNEAVKRL